jgi:hypothetical protein
MQPVIVASFLRTPNLILQHQQQFPRHPQSLLHAYLKLSINSKHAQLFMTLCIKGKLLAQQKIALRASLFGRF